jgi:hypothetical protein
MADRRRIKPGEVRQAQRFASEALDDAQARADTVACPVCLAPVGKPCSRVPQGESHGARGLLVWAQEDATVPA